MSNDKAKTLMQAGKQIAAVAAGRAFASNEAKTAEDLLNDPDAERQGTQKPPAASTAASATDRAADQG